MLCTSCTLKGSGAYWRKVGALKISNPPPVTWSFATLNAVCQALMRPRAEVSSSKVLIVFMRSYHSCGITDAMIATAITM